MSILFGTGWMMSLIGLKIARSRNLFNLMNVKYFWSKTFLGLVCS
jgi:hypothetical protein